MMIAAKRSVDDTTSDISSSSGFTGWQGRSLTYLTNLKLPAAWVLREKGAEQYEELG
jgi:hypothetical protein